MKPIIFVFKVSSLIVQLQYIHWGIGNLPCVGDYVYLFDFLTPENRNVTINNSVPLSQSGYNVRNIDKYLKDFKFRVDEKIFRLNDRQLGIQYNVTAIPW